jgi:hypothetical protein
MQSSAQCLTSWTGGVFAILGHCPFHDEEAKQGQIKQQASQADAWGPKTLLE